MRSLSKVAVLTLHARLLARHGGSPGVRDLRGLESALAQADSGFGGVETYPTVPDKVNRPGFTGDWCASAKPGRFSYAPERWRCPPRLPTSGAPRLRRCGASRLVAVGRGRPVRATLGVDSAAGQVYY